MEITLLRKPEDIIVAVAKGELFNNEDGRLRIQKNKLIAKYLFFTIRGDVYRKIDGNKVIYDLVTRLGSLRMIITVDKIDEYSSKTKIEFEPHGLFGRILKSIIIEDLFSFIIDLEFRKSVTLEKRMLIKMYTNRSGLHDMLSKLTLDPSSYYFLVINKEYIVEIVNGIELSTEDLESICKDVCYVELYELVPHTI